MIQVSLCRVGPMAGARWYTKNMYFSGVCEKDQKILSALNINPPYKKQYILDVSVKP